MTTVAPPVDHNALEQYVMPRPNRGAAILWFPNCNPAEQPEIGFVIKSGARNLVIRLGSGTARDGVRHISDPKLKLSAAQRENGAWDFVEDTRELIALRAEVGTLRQELDDLAQQVTELNTRLSARGKKDA